MTPFLRLVVHLLFLIPATHAFGQLNLFAPEILGQTPSPLTTEMNTPITIELRNLIVLDADPLPVYPNGFSLVVLDDKNYAVKDATVTPKNNFTGMLEVPVRVNDGKNISRKFNLKIEVTGSTNVRPEITGQVPLQIDQTQTLTIELSHLQVSDPDSQYPQDFTLKVFNGDNYTLNGNTITPSSNFTGNLKVPVSVNDGQNESKPFDLKVAVTKVQNIAPIITGQTALSTPSGIALAISLSNLLVTDPDNKYPDDFTLKISPGNNYSVDGNAITPAKNFIGQLIVKVKVNDGKVDSETFDLKVQVNVQNTPPVITGQKGISIVQNSALTIQFSHLLVTDPDNKYPTGFSLRVLPGDNYIVEGTTIRPLPNFVNNTLSVRVVVNDGMNDSQPFDLKVQVVPSSSTPIINGQKELTIPEDSSLVVSLAHLEVTDEDNLNYPKGFSLTVLPSTDETYTASGNTVTPALNLNGFIEVGVKVSDGVNLSDEFKLSILITPVNDAPEILNFPETEVAYEPGKEPVSLFETLDVIDVDNDHLSMVEIGFRSDNHSPANDELLSSTDSINIKRIYDPAGILFLVGYATLDEYKAAIRSVEYHYRMTEDENGNPAELQTGTRTVYINIHDGQNLSKTHELKISMQTDVALDIPNAFTPNGDMSNDTWRIDATNKDQLDNAVIRVYNKKGLLLYESIGFENEWDGISNGQVLPTDTYYYTIDLNLSYMKKTYKGAVTILH